MVTIPMVFFIAMGRKDNDGRTKLPNITDDIEAANVDEEKEDFGFADFIISERKS